MQLKQKEIHEELKKSSLDQKEQSPASLVSKEDEKSVLMSGIDILKKEIEEVNQETQHFKEEISKAYEAITFLKESIAGQQALKLSLEADIIQLREKQQFHQNQADIYALIKYMTFLNLYSALPNDDFDYHEYTVPVTTLSLDAIPVIRHLTNDRAQKVALDNTRNATEREISKLLGLIEEYSSKTAKDNLKTSIQEYLQGILRSGSSSYEASSSIVTMVQGAYKKEILSQRYQSKKSYDYWPLPIESDEEYQKENEEKLNSLRADRQIKKSMNKWRNKIDQSSGSLIQRLGLNSAIFNSDFSLRTYPHILSFAELQTALKGTNLISYPETLKTSKVWSLSLMQLRMNFFDALVKKDVSILRRVEPIFNFIESKLKGVSILSTMTPEGQKIGFKQHLLNNKNKAVEHAYLKYISYMNMLYALRHNGEGVSVTEVKITDPAIEEIIAHPLPQEMRVDKIMAAKAYKWGQRVLEHGQEFIDENALQAHIFTPLSKENAQ